MGSDDDNRVRFLEVFVVVVSSRWTHTERKIGPPPRAHDWDTNAIQLTVSQEIHTPVSDSNREKKALESMAYEL